MTVSTRIAGLAATAVLALGGALNAPAAMADEAAAPDGPCAQKQAQVTKAEGALARVNAVFERKATRVAKAKKEVAAAEDGRAEAQARKDLAAAKRDQAEVRTTKRAQQQRLAKAQERLAACEAAQPETAPAPAEPAPDAPAPDAAPAPEAGVTAP